MTKEEAVQDYLKCKYDIAYFIFKYCYTSDARDMGKEKIAPDFPYLHRLLNLWETKKKTTTNKSRQLFVSNLAMLRYLHKLKWGHNNWKGRLISEKSELIIDGDGALFNRIVLANDKLPDHLRTRLTMTKKPMLIYNPINKNQLQGSTTTTSTGRGGTYDETFLDEFAFYTVNARQILTSVIPASEKVHIVSTPKGKNHHYKTFHEAEEKLEVEGELDRNFHPVTLQWYEHPERDQEWFDTETSGLTPTEIAQEYLLSFEQSQEGRVFSIIKEGMLVKRKPINIQEIFDGRLRVKGGMDTGIADDTSVTLAIQSKATKDMKIIYNFTRNNMLPEKFMTEMVNDIFAQNIFDTKQKADVKQILKKYSDVFIDPSSFNRQPSSGRGVAEDYIDLGLNLIMSARQLVLDGIRKMQRWFTSKSFTIYQDIENVIDNIVSCHYPIKNGEVTDTSHYAHEGKGECNFNSHVVDSVRYLLSNVEIPVGENRTVTTYDSIKGGKVGDKLSNITDNKKLVSEALKARRKQALNKRQ